MFVQGFYWLVKSLNQYDTQDYNDLFYSRFVVVNNPHTGMYKYKLDTEAMKRDNRIKIKNSEKFKGLALRIGRVSTSVFPNSKFILTGSRHVDEVNETIEKAIEFYSPYFTDELAQG